MVYEIMKFLFGKEASKTTRPVFGKEVSKMPKVKVKALSKGLSFGKKRKLW